MFEPFQVVPERPGGLWGPARHQITPAMFFVVWEGANITPVVLFVAWKGSNITPVVFFVAPWGGGGVSGAVVNRRGGPPKRLVFEYF